MSQSSLIMPTIVLITSHFSNSAKFHGNVKILWQKANSAAWLEIPWLAEKSGPTDDDTITLGCTGGHHEVAGVNITCSYCVPMPTRHVIPPGLV